MRSMRFDIYFWFFASMAFVTFVLPLPAASTVHVRLATLCLRQDLVRIEMSDAVYLCSAPLSSFGFRRSPIFGLACHAAAAPISARCRS